MKANFDNAIKLVFGSEGGYSNRKTDAGGPTKYGITAATLGAWRKLGRPAIAAEVQALTLAEAREILEKQYAAPIRFDDLPAGLDYAVFDYAVNAGPAQAVKSLQRVLGVARDGVIGAKTLQAAQNEPLPGLIDDYCDERLRFLQGLGGPTGWAANGKGWKARVDRVRAQASRMAAGVNVKAAVMSTPDDPGNVSSGADAKADVTTTKLSATTGGKGSIVAAIGIVTTVVGSIKDALQPLVGTSHVVDTLMTTLTVVGVVAVVAGIGVTTYSQLRHIGSGAPV